MNRPLTNGGQRDRGFVAAGGLAVILTLCLASSMTDQRWNLPHWLSATEAHAEEAGSYDATVVYSGMFESEQIYKIVLGPGTWAGSRRPARSKEVTCRDARTALERKGWWTGPLNADGACGSGEPSDWALGNFLNFQTGLEDAESDR